eukprot:1088345-Prorocentrum_minimum.AAC.4
MNNQTIKKISRTPITCGYSATRHQPLALPHRHHLRIFRDARGGSFAERHGSECCSVRSAAEALCVPSGALCVPSGALCVLSGALCVPSGPLGVPSGPLGVPAGTLGIPSGALCVPAGALGIPSGALCDHSLPSATEQPPAPAAPRSNGRRAQKWTTCSHTTRANIYEAGTGCELMLVGGEFTLIGGVFTSVGVPHG